MTTSTSTPALTSTKTWIWQGFPICYQTQGTTGPAVILVHGFGASWCHWRKNIPVLAENCRVYAIDLIGLAVQRNQNLVRKLLTQLKLGDSKWQIFAVRSWVNLLF
jgi:pimeloyl-ACP methyl ester carboxylesterase